MKKAFLTTVATLVFGFQVTAEAATDVRPPVEQRWPFEGVFGTVDRQAAQRGFQVYKNVCATCHGLKRIAFRNLMDIGFTEEEAKAIAAEYTVTDGPDDEGEMFERSAVLSDRFPPPFANEQAAKAANNGAVPPDLSLIVKARPNGANYLYSLMTGYTEAPEDVKVPAGLYYNPYFPGHKIAMPPPLSEGLVDYQDGTPATLDQMAQDLTVFLQWAAEPKMEERKQVGLKVIFFLILATVFLYIAKVRVWRNVEH